MYSWTDEHKFEDVVHCRSFCDSSSVSMADMPCIRPALYSFLEKKGLWSLWRTSVALSII